MTTDTQLTQLERITELISLLNNEKFKSTIDTISRVTETGNKQTREEIAELQRCGAPIYPEESAAFFRDGGSYYDNKEIFIDSPVIDDQFDTALYFCAPEERIFVNTKDAPDFFIKRTTEEPSHAVREHIGVIEKAIAGRNKIQFRYASPNDATKTIVIAPVSLYQNINNGTWYCISFPDAVNIFPYRLDRIKFQIKILEDIHFRYPSEKDPRMQRLKKTWGGSFDNTEEMQELLLRVLPGPRNLINKIKADTARRGGKWTFEEESWYYEDTFIGVSAVKSWLLKYGSAIEVIKPDILRHEIISSAKNRLNNYRENRFVY